MELVSPGTFERMMTSIATVHNAVMLVIVFMQTKDTTGKAVPWTTRLLFTAHFIMPLWLFMFYGPFFVIQPEDISCNIQVFMLITCPHKIKTQM